MKKLILMAAVLCSSTLAFAANDRIYFQKDSAWVTASNKTLCKTDSYYLATLTVCAKYNGREESSCAREISYTAFQPMTSTKQVCAKPATHDRCDQWQTVSYYQSPNLEIRYYGAHDRIVKRVPFTVPNCN